MIKHARRPSQDSAQEKLRQNKAVWNKDISALINDVIHLKKLMNGWPSKYYKDRSKITFPIPADPGTILNGLASNFQELAQQGNAIVQEQLQYSKTRRLPRQQQSVQTLNKLDEKYGPTEGTVPPPLGAPPSGGDLAEKLSKWEEKYGLVAEGSNPFSRFITRLITPQIGFGADAQKRRLRMDMLKAAIKSYRALGKMQIHVTKSSKQSVVDAYRAMQEAWNEWSVVSRNFNTIVNSMPDQAKRPEEMREETHPNVEPDLLQKAPPVKPEAVIPTKENKETEDETLIKKKPEPPSFPPLKGTNPPVASASDQLEVVAQAFLKKWLGKARHSILPGKSSGLRLQAYAVADKARKSVDIVMDLLEKGFDIEALGPKISEVSSYINELRSLMRSLHNTEKPAPKGKNAPSEGFF